MNIVSKDWEGRECILMIDGEPVQHDAVVKNFRGDDVTVMGGSAPHKPTASGFVYLERGRRYVGVINAEWVRT